MNNNIPEVSIIVPTFREVSNIEELATRVTAALSEYGRSAELIIVDDDSQDGTIELCCQLARQLPLRLITRRNERGLATAVIRGLREARGNLLVVMDADLSHPPETVPHLLTALESDNTDFVIGSRYVDGGSVDKSWSPFRHLNSRLATVLAAGLTTARDPMAGFFAIRSTDMVATSRLNPCGYKIGLELIVRCGCRNVVEVPIHFEDRRHGESKLNLKEQWLYLKHLTRLYAFRYPDSIRFTLFSAVGLSGLLVDLASFQTLLPSLGLATSRAVAIWIAMSWNYFLNRHLTFNDADASMTPVEYLRFCTACLLGGALSWSVSLTLMRTFSFFSTRPVAGAVAGVCVAAMVNYAMCSLWVFRRRRMAIRTAAKTPAIMHAK